MADKISLSQIREQFPMYADVPDYQLIGAIHKKFYSDIPRDKFISAINFDTNKMDPTEGMSGTEKFLAGAGKAFVDIGRGVGQVFGAVSHEDVANSRKLDEPLMKTGAGRVGNFTGNVAALTPLAFVPGANTMAGSALIGAGTGFLGPSASTEETLRNTAFGAIAGPAALGLTRLAGAGYQGAKALLEPFTSSGQERIAAQTLRQFANDPAKAAASLQGARELVPGSAPTMAQAADDAGLAQLERTLMNNPETGGRLADQYAAQRAARLASIQGLAGDSAKRAAAVDAREAAAAPLYQQAKAAVYEMDPAIDALLKTPVGKQALSRAKDIAANNNRPFQFTTETSAPFSGVGGRQVETTRQVTGQGLHDIKMALDDMLSNPMSGIAKSEADTVKGIRGKLVNWMEGQNDAFKGARTTYAKESVPINTMDVAQALMDKLQPALARYGANTREQANAYATALQAAEETVKKATGIDKPIGELIDQQAKKLLDNIAKDLGRKARAEDMGRAVGSNTAQNLAAQNLLRRTLGPTGLPQSWAESNVLQGLLAPYTGVAKLAGADNKVMERLLKASLDPQDAANLLMQASAQPVGLLGSRIAPALPVATNAGLLSYRAQ